MGITRVKKMYEDKKDRRKGDFLFTEPVKKKTGRKRKSVQKKATMFESRMIRFLKNLGMQDVNGGPAFKPGGYQVDACGGYEDRLFIIDCTLTDKRKKVTLRSKIKEIRGTMRQIRKGLRTESTYKEKYAKYNQNKNVIFLLATRNIEVSKADEEEAKKRPSIIIWKEDFINHYEKLSRLIGKYAKYHLFGEMELVPAIEDYIAVPAFQLSWDGKNVLYNFLIEPQRLLMYSYVARREVGKEENYQRILDGSRIKNIRDFLKKGGFFPNNIIISINEECEFKKLTTGYEDADFWPNWLTFGLLKFPAKYRSCWIIDGQHRLYSFTETLTQKIPVTAFVKLLPVKQASFFVEINKEQKPVDRNLIWDLEEWMRPSKEEGIISKTVKLLDEKGIFENKIAIPSRGMSGRKIRFTSFCDSIKYRRLVKKHTEKMLAGKSKNPYYSEDYTKTSENLAKVLNLYFTEIDNLFGDEAKDFLFDNGGISVMVIIFERLLSILQRKLQRKDINEYLGLIKRSWSGKEKDFFNDQKLRCTSEGGKNLVAKEVIRILSKHNKLFNRYLLEEVTVGEDLDSLEIGLRDFLNNILSSLSRDWLKEKTFPGMIGRLKHRAKGEEGELYTFLTLGECFDIIARKDNWEKIFKPIFVGKEKEFDNEELFLGTAKAIKRMRNKIDHARGEPPTVEEENRTKEYIKKLMRCLKLV